MRVLETKEISPITVVEQLKKFKWPAEDVENYITEHELKPDFLFTEKLFELVRLTNEFPPHDIIFATNQSLDIPH